MSTKTKSKKTTADKFNEVALQGGVVLMAAAATLGMIELPEHPNKVVVQHQPVFAFATESSNNEGNNPMRREREEAGPHYVSYSAVQRTPGRTGKI